MRVIVGLGNPGEKYEDTRHNLGFVTLDHLLKKYEPLKESNWDNNSKTKCEIKKLSICNIPTLLVKPQTYMNNSGMGVKAALDYYKAKSEDLIVIHDDLDLPLGKLQIRFGGGSAGHNGIESLLETLKTDKFLRIRMGIGHPKRIDGAKFNTDHHQSVEGYVLSNFLENEHKDVRNMIKHVQKNIELILEHGNESFMSKYNVKA